MNQSRSPSVRASSDRGLPSHVNRTKPGLDSSTSSPRMLTIRTGRGVSKGTNVPATRQRRSARNQRVAVNVRRTGPSGSRSRIPRRGPLRWTINDRRPTRSTSAGRRGSEDVGRSSPRAAGCPFNVASTPSARSKKTRPSLSVRVPARSGAASLASTMSAEAAAPNSLAPGLRKNSPATDNHPSSCLRSASYSARHSSDLRCVGDPGGRLPRGQRLGRPLSRPADTPATRLGSETSSSF